MDIGNKYLSSWLNFDESATKDFIADNHVQAFENPTISTTNAISNKALQLDGNSYLKISGIELCEKDFTVDCWITMNSATSNRASIFSIVNPETGFGILNVRKKENSNCIEMWANSSSNASKDNGYTYAASNNIIGNRVHIALTYHQADDGVEYTPQIRLYINGVLAVSNSWQIKGYYRKAYNLFIGKYNDTSNNYFVGSIDEFRVYDGVRLWTGNFTPPAQSFYTTHTFHADMIRNVKSTSSWRYENIGVVDSLINTTTAVQLRDLTVDKSKTTKAFYQTQTGIKLFDVPSTNEIWIKFDVYFNGSKRWRCYDCSTDVANNITTGVTAQTSGAISLFNRSTNVKQIGNIAKINSLQTVILHMKADSTDGLIEVYTDDNGFVCEYIGEVNNGVDFSNLYLQSDGAGTFFSNIVISNNPLWFDDNAKVTVNTNIICDAERCIKNDVIVYADFNRHIYKAPNVYYFDFERVILETSHNETLVLDTQRRIINTVSFNSDVLRNVYKSLNESFDIQRKVRKNYTYCYDLQRTVGFENDLNVDIQRIIEIDCLLNADIQRNIMIDISLSFDLCRKIPHDIKDDGQMLQSITVGIQEQQLTDNISFVYTGVVDVLDNVSVKLIDYINNCCVEEINQKGILTTCKCTADIEEILYQQLAYEIEPTEYEWTGEYLNELNQQRAKYPDYKIEAVPSASASTHIKYIANALGLNTVLIFDDWISTLNTKVKSGTNYANLIRELLGWTSRIPTMMINCYIRNNNLYVIQRGKENNVVDLDGENLTLHTTNRKIVRMMWGSDAWSKTEVTSYKGNKYYDEFQDVTPINLDDDSKTYDDDGLIETTTVNHGEETVITYYDYTEQENGKKFLSQETAVTYRKGEEVDRVTTYHDPVRNTQSHVYSVDDSGVLGGVVTSSNNDDRISPYNKGYSGHSDGFIFSSNGKYYWASGIKHVSEEYEQGQLKKTLHGISLIDTSFPVDGDSKLEELTNKIKWLDRKIEESITVDLYDYPHVVDFNDKIIFHGHTYFLRSNTAIKSEKIVNKQSLEFVRWF